MKYAIFGCTADPFTEAHQAIVSNLLTQGLVDHVIIAPTIVNYHREGKAQWLTDEQKLKVIYERLSNDAEMKKLSQFKRGCWSIWDKDFKIRKVCEQHPVLNEKYVNNHRFIDTLIEIIEQYDFSYYGEYTQNEYYVVIGSDSYWNFKTWHMWEEITKLAKLIVVDGRNGIGLPSNYPKCITMQIDPKLADVSATLIRAEWRKKGFDAYFKYVKDSFDDKTKNDEMLLHTSIFDVVQGAKTDSGLKPLKINAPDWVTIIVKMDDQFLVEKQFRYGSNCEIEEFPCGQVEFNEDPLDTAIRELEEETGIKILDKTKVKKLGSVNPNPAFMTNTMHYFYVNLSNTEFVQVEKKLDEHEKITVEWIDIDDFYKKVIKDVFNESNKVPAMLLATFGLMIGLKSTTIKHNYIF